MVPVNPSSVMIRLRMLELDFIEYDATSGIGSVFFMDRNMQMYGEFLSTAIPHISSKVHGAFVSEGVGSL